MSSICECATSAIAMNRTRALTSKNNAILNCIQRNIHQHNAPSITCNKLHATNRHYSDCPGSTPTLKRQPVPKLKDTMDRYLKSCIPFLNKTEYEQTKKLTDEMGKACGSGDKLQKFLVSRAASTENWLSDWWTNAAYLEFRKTVVMWSSPGQIMPIQQFKSEQERLCYTAKIILTAMDYKKLIDEGKIPQEKQGKDNLDMQQYKKIFGTNRIPLPKRDCIQFNPESKHIVIIYKNRFFQINLFGEDCVMVNTDQLACTLLVIIENTKQAGPPIGILSSNNRDSWAAAREILVKAKTNKESICIIEQALFVVCLDEKVETNADDVMTKSSEQFIHGGGVCVNSANRWFDKTVQFILGPDGKNGLTYEHSPAEGVPIAVMVDFLANNVNKERKGKGTSCVPAPKALCFCVNKEVQAAIDEAIKNMDAIVTDLDLQCFKFDCFGSKFIKSIKFSPDSFFQMAIQYAFYRLHCVPGAHYESAATRKFLHGRTETIRSCSLESLCFSRFMLDEKKSDTDRLELLKKATSGHKEYTTAAVNGLGVDRHLFGLRKAAQELKLEVPKLFSDPAFVRSSHMRLSTSQVATKCDGLMSYGPSVTDGYGVCYNIRPDDINIAVSSFRCDKDTDSYKFRKALFDSMIDMRDLVQKEQKAKL